MFEKRPGAHGMHFSLLLAPGVFPALPGGQRLQSFFELTPDALEKVATGHGVHVVMSRAPSFVLYVPSPHGMQRSFWGLGYVPGAHGLHDSLLPYIENAPLAHALQLDVVFVIS